MYDVDTIMSVARLISCSMGLMHQHSHQTYSVK